MKGRILVMLAFGLVACRAEKAERVEGADQETFATPQAAGDALVAAARAHDRAAVLRIVGPVARQFSGGDSALQVRDMDLFVEAYEQVHRWVATLDGQQVLRIGAQNYPFPVPLERETGNGRWRFDSAEGEEELAERTVEANEVLAQDALRAIVNSQEVFRKRMGKYARKILSAPGQRDGLYWKAKDSTDVSPLGNVEQFIPEVATMPFDSAPVFDGYRFYLVPRGKTFFVVAVPSAHGGTGVKSFLLGDDNYIYEKDLGASWTGPASAVAVDSSWQVVE